MTPTEVVTVLPSPLTMFMAIKVMKLKRSRYSMRAWPLAPSLFFWNIFKRIKDWSVYDNRVNNAECSCFTKKQDYKKLNGQVKDLI